MSNGERTRAHTSARFLFRWGKITVLIPNIGTLLFSSSQSQWHKDGAGDGYRVLALASPVGELQPCAEHKSARAPSLAAASPLTDVILVLRYWPEKNGIMAPRGSGRAARRVTLRCF